MNARNVVPSHNEVAHGKQDPTEFGTEKSELHGVLQIAMLKATVLQTRNCPKTWRRDGFCLHSYMRPEQGKTLHQASFSCDNNGKCTLLVLLYHYLCSRYQNTQYEPYLLEWVSWIDVYIACTTKLFCRTGRLVCLHPANTALLSKVWVKAMGGLHSLEVRRGRLC